MRDRAVVTRGRPLLVGVVLVVVVTTAGTAAGGADAATQPGDAVIEDDGVYFVGQVLFTDVFDADDGVVLRTAEGEFVSDVVPGEDGGVLLRTERFGAGDYRLVADDGTEIAFQVEEQFYTVEADADTVLDGGGGSETRLSLSVESNRAGYRTVVTAAGLSTSQLRSVFDDAGAVTSDVDDDGASEVVLPDGRPERTLSADFRGVPPGQYAITFSVLDTPARSTVPVEVRLFPDGEATLTVEGSPTRIQQASGRQIRGTSTLPDGTRLRIVVENASERPFRVTERAVVQNGVFRTAVDLSDVPVGQRFTITVEQGPVVRDRVEGVVVRRAGVSATATATRETVTVDSAVLPDGGFATVSTVQGERLGVSESLPPGETEGVTVELAEPLPPGDRELVVRLRRDDGDGALDVDDEPYRLQGAPIGRVVSVTVGATPTRTTTTTTVATTRTTSTTTEATTTAGTTTTTSGTAEGAGSSGFGLGVALLGIGVVVALVLALLGAGRDGAASEGDDGEE